MGRTLTGGGDTLTATIDFDIDGDCQNSTLSNIGFNNFSGRLNFWMGNRYEFGFGIFVAYEEHMFNGGVVFNDLPSESPCCQKKEARVKVRWHTKMGVDFTIGLGPITPLPDIPGVVMVDQDISNFEIPVVLKCCGNQLSIDMQ